MVEQEAELQRALAAVKSATPEEAVGLLQRFMTDEKFAEEGCHGAHISPVSRESPALSQGTGTACYAPHTAAPCAGVTLRTLSIFLTCYHSVAASSTADPQHVLLATPPYTQSLSACTAAPSSQRHLFSYTIPLAPHCIGTSKYARVWNALGYLSIQGWVRSALDSRLLSVSSAQLPHPSTAGLSRPENMYVHTVLGGIKQRLICIDRASDVLMKHTACHCTVHSFASCLDLSVCVTCQHIAV